MKITKMICIVCILVTTGCRSNEIQPLEEIIATSSPTSGPTSSPESSSVSPAQIETASPPPYFQVIDKTNLKQLALLRQWDVERLPYFYDSGNFWFSDSNQFLMPVIDSPSLVGLQSFAVDNSTPLWFIPSLHVDFTINEQSQVILNLEGLKIFNSQGEKIQAVQTNEQCDIYSPLSSHILAIPGTSTVVTGVQDSYSDFGLHGDQTDRARVLIWDMYNHTCSNLIEQFDGFITSLSASYDGRYISYVVVALTIDPRIRTTRVFDLELRKEKCELAGGLDARFTPQGQLVVYDVTDGRIFVISPEDCSVEKEFNVGLEIIYAFSLTPEGDLLAGVTNSAVLFWDLRTGEKLHEIGTGGSNLGIIGFSPDGRYLVTAERLDFLSKKDRILLWGISSE